MQTQSFFKYHNKNYFLQSIHNIKNSEFRGAFTGEIGINSEKDNNFLLKRIGVIGGEKLWELKSKILLANIVKYIYKKSNKSFY